MPARPSAAQERALGAVNPWDKAQHRRAEGQMGHSFTGGGTSSCRRANQGEDSLVEHQSRLLMGCDKQGSKPKIPAKRMNVAVVAVQLVQHNDRSS